MTQTQQRLELGVDEFTLVLQSNEKVDGFHWCKHAEIMLNRFLEKSKLDELFGVPAHSFKPLQVGYTSSMVYDTKPWHLSLSWHDDFPGMGLCVKFSAWAWAAYREAYEADYLAEMDIAVFLRMVQDDIYTIRLSRIDLTADYFNYPCPSGVDNYLSPDALYRAMERGQYTVASTDVNGLKRTINTRSAIHKDGAYQTFYVGGRKGKSNTFLRVYDKRTEQLAQNGFRYDDAVRCESWVRCEAVFKHDYAHQITEILLSANTATLPTIIAGLMVGRYVFLDTSKAPLEISADLELVAVGSTAVTLSRPSPRDNDLKQSIDHLRLHSGLYPTLFKAWMVWGGDADRQLLDYLISDYICNYKINVNQGDGPYKPKKRELESWHSRHGEEIKKSNLTDYFPPVDEKAALLSPMSPGGDEDDTPED